MRWLVRTSLVGSLLGLLLTGCAGRPLAVSPGLAERSVALHAHKLDRRSIDFGDYQVREIRRGWETGGGVQVGRFSAAKSSRNFSFMIAHADRAMLVRCNLAKSAAAIGNLVVDSDSQVLCDLDPSSAGTPWTLIIVQHDTSPTQGRLQQGPRELQIVPAHGSGHPWSRGYLVREDGDVAAADVRRKTRTMWLPKAGDPETNLALAGAAMALMLLEEVD